MFRVLSRLLLLLAAVQILGGHWAALQTLAWTGMLVDNLQRKPIAEALASTFDGSQPCSLCNVVTEGRKSEDRQDLAKVVVKIEAILAPAIQLPPRGETQRQFFNVAGSDREGPCAVIKPPPRLA